jgi:hypothetical protein
MSDGLSGPHLSAAFLCERILQERDGVPSFIRVVDRFLVPVIGKLPPGIQQMQPPVLQVILVISLKAGSLGAGKYNIRIKLNKPDGSEMQDNTHSVFFNGSDDNGVLLGSPTLIVAPDEGLYWFDVYFEDALMTRIPMRVIHQQVALPPQFPQQQP